MLVLALIGCGSEVIEAPAPSPAPRMIAAPSVLPMERLVVDLGARREPALGAARQLDGYRVVPVALDAAPGFRVGAALYEPDEPLGRAVLMAHGHFDGGKSAPEAQELSHRLARRGVTVLAVDNPGMEAWGRPERAIHTRRGAVNRWWLASAGSSALALQLGGLVGGLDLLEQRGFEEITATGASGGAVLSFWLALIDERVDGVVLAAVPDIPRRPDEGGCSCKTVPGLPGPSSEVVAQLEVPSLWLSERDSGPPDGLSAAGRWLYVPGPHSYTEAMQREALAFLGLPLEPWSETPDLDLRTIGPGEQVEHLELRDLPLTPAGIWSPAPTGGLVPELSCEGSGPTVVVVGDDEAHAPLVAAGYRACGLTIDVSGADAALTRGEVFADAAAGAVAAAVSGQRAIAAWGAGPWAVPVAGSGVRHVLREPIDGVEDLTPETAWVQVPGLWWGVLPQLWGDAAAIDPSPNALIAALPE